MKRNGFSLIELVVVIALMGTLMAIGGLVYSSMTRKASIEKQVRELNADLANARSQALYRKTYRYVTVTGMQFSVYSASAIKVPPPTIGAIVQKSLRYAVTVSPADEVYFDPRGAANLTSSDISGSCKAICIQPNNTDALDSILISATGIQVGRLSKGGTCDCAHVTIQ